LGHDSELKKEIEQAISCWLQCEEIDRAEAYGLSGRRFAALASAELVERWAEAFRVWALDFRTDHPDRSDLEAELQLRGIKYPYELVATEFNTLLEMARGFGEELATNRRRLEWLGKVMLRRMQCLHDTAAQPH
jgi:hypothetical protein